MGENFQIQLIEKNLKTTTNTYTLNRFAKPSQILDLVSQYGSPIYLIDENTLHFKANELLNAYEKYKGPKRIAYSVKANFIPSILRSFMKDGITFDLTSLGELYFLKRCNIESEHIIYTSITEEEEEYVQVLLNGITKIVVSSFNGMTNLVKAAEKTNVKPQTLIRINPEVGVKAEIRASYKNGKFGVPFNGETIDSAFKIVKHIVNNEFLNFDGFHFHLGSQITNFSCYSNTFSKLNAFISKIKKDIPSFKINTIDIGGGTPVFYNHPVPTPKQMAENYITKLNQLADDHGRFELIIESGRFLVAESAILLTRIVNMKEYNGHKIVIVDAGYHILLDSALMKQEYPQEVVDSNNTTTIYRRNPSLSPKNIHVAGRLCDTYDVFPLSEVSNLDHARIGNYISFYNVGAYSVVFNMPFHCQTKPPIVMKTSSGDFKLVRKGTTYENLFEEEGGCIP
jgi:diaminopimelate decarboxylase